MDELRLLKGLAERMEGFANHGEPEIPDDPSLGVEIDRDSVRE